MMVIGCDYHPTWQRICWLDTSTGETGEKKLEHAAGEPEKFYRGLPGPALIGIESRGNFQWFVDSYRGAPAVRIYRIAYGRAAKKLWEGNCERECLSGADWWSVGKDLGNADGEY